MATYDTSSYGKYIVVSEGSGDLSPVRIVLIIITLVLGVTVKLREAIVFWSRFVANKKTYLFVALFIVYVCNSVLHTAHYADCIARPVNYFTPKWLYKRYLLSTMEIAFIINLLITFIGYKAITKLLVASIKCERETIQRYCRLMLIYIIGSLLTLAHYRYEPPSSFSGPVNFTIVGEGVTAVLLTVIVVRIAYLNSRNRFNNSDSMSLDNLVVPDIYGTSDDDEEVETFSRDKVQRARRRSRSKTPTEITAL